MAAEETPRGSGGARGLEALLASGDLRIETVFCPFDTLFLNQVAVPVRVDLRNGSNAAIEIYGIKLLFSSLLFGDRSQDYTVATDLIPGTVIPSGDVASYNFNVDVEPDALTDTDINVDAYVEGVRLDTYEPVIDSTWTESFRDEFDTISYGGNNGTINWSGDWLEVGETDGPAESDVQVALHPILEMGYALRIGGMGFHAGRGAKREANLSGATATVLTFDMVRSALTGESDVFVQISGNGGLNWTTLQTIVGGTDNTPVTMVREITPFIGPNTQIRFITEADGHGYVYFDNIQIVFTPGLRTDHWIVTSESAPVITAIAALFDTRGTIDRADDSLMCLNYGEQFLLNRVHYLNGGYLLGEIPYENFQFFRLVLQINPVSDWEWEPKDSEEGYIAFEDTTNGFGRISAPRPGIKEFLVTETVIPDEEDDPADIVRGVTEKFAPAVPWNMQSDPWIDPIVDTGKTHEYGALIMSSPPARQIIDCRDQDKHWEVTGKCEYDRYYFFETWFQPDLEWTHGDTADIYMHLRGKPDPSDIEELHVVFRMVDDDTVGPDITEFNPLVVPAGQLFDITCLIYDPSGVYDDDTGVGGQGVYLLWDTDGSIADDYYEVQMSHAGGGYYITDTQLGPFVEGEEILYVVVAFDNDFDNADPADRSYTISDPQGIQIVGSIYLIDDPFSLQPNCVYPSQQYVTFYVSLTNPMSGGMYLYTSSNLTFSAGGDTIKTNLSNDTYVEVGAAGFPISFDTVDMPVDFSSPDTLDVVLFLDGLYDGTTPFTQTWILSPTNRLFVLEPTLHCIPYSIPSPSVHPGASGVELLRFELACESFYNLRLDSLVVSNITDGARAVPDNDANIGKLYLYKQGVPAVSESPILQAAGERLGVEAPDTEGNLSRDRSDEGNLRNRPPVPGDSLIATAELIGGNAVFDITGGSVLPAWESYYYYVRADVDSFLACDGDSLDLEIRAPDSLFITGRAAKLFYGVPLDSEGKSAVNGSMSFQFSLSEGLPDTLYSSDVDQLVLIADIPANGYAPDVLTGLSIKNYGDNEADAVLASLRLWADDGDGTFSNQSDDLIGNLQYTGDRFQLSGIACPVAGPQRLFVTADFGEDFSQELVVGLGIPVDGVQYESGNDGPVDADVIPHSYQLLIRREYVVLETIVRAIEIGSVYPGEEDIELFAFRIRNKTLGSITVDSISVNGSSDLFVCEPGKQVELYIDDGDLSFNPEMDTGASIAELSSGSGMFGDVALDIEADGDEVFFVSTDLDSYLTVDGETLTVGIGSADNVHLTLSTGNVFDIDGQFPLEGAGNRITDGMLSHQVTMHPGMDTTIVDQRDDVLILDFTVPGNGCLDDTLTALVIYNAGTAGDKHIERALLWRDTGDGQFDRQLDDSLAEFSTIQERVYAVSDLSVHLAGSTGERLFVTVDLREDFTTGATILAAIPVLGIAVASGNDGPLDDYLLSDANLLIPIPDRVTFYTSILDNKRVYPGGRNVLNMVLGAYNSYTGPKELQSLILVKGGTSLQAEIKEVAAYADTDSDGLFDPEKDDLLQIAEPADIFYIFDDLSMTLPPYKSSVVFVAYTMVDRAVRDSVSIDFGIINQSHIVFSEDGVNIEGDFPLNSAGIDETDGMVSRQIDCFVVWSARVSPGDDDVPCFSLRLPCNGTLEDSLKSFTLENLGTAIPGEDIEYFKLWREAGGGSTGFDPGIEELIGYLAWDGSNWSTVSLLSELMPCEGFVLHITADIAATAVDGRTLNVSLPVNGVEVLSGNDGPIDRAITSSAVVTVTTDPLISSFYPLPPVTLQQGFEVGMSVSNVSDSILTAVVPDSFTYSGDGSLTMLSGPTPVSIDMPAHSDSSFVWTFRADATGEIVFRARVRESGGNAKSQFELSDTLLIEDVPDNFTITLDDLSRVSLNRGQEDATLVELTMSYDISCGQCAGVDLVSFDILFMNGSGSPIPVRDVASYVQFEDESSVLYAAGTTGLDQPLLEITLSEPVLFVPGNTKRFYFTIDVAGMAAAGEFMLGIETGDYIELKDHNSGDPVTFSGVTLPWYTQTVSLDDPATELAVHFNDVLPGIVNRGQERVEAFELVISNVGGPGAADISVSEIEFKTVDEGSNSVFVGNVFRSVTVEDQMENPYCHLEMFAPSASLRCRLEPSVIVSAQIPVTLKLFIDCLSDPEPAGFFIILQDSIDVVARDINSGSAVPVAPDTAAGDAFPMESSLATFCDPLQAVSITGEKLLPGMITAGQNDVGALQVVLEHTGQPTESWSRWTGITVRLLDEVGEGLEPNGIFEVVRVRSDLTDLAVAYITAAHTSTIVLPFIQDIVTPPGGRDSLEVLLDVNPSTPNAYFQIHVNAQGFEVSDATDGGIEVDLIGDFPLTSGIGSIVLPAEEVVFDADALLPSNVTADSDCEVFGLRFSREADSGGSLVLIEGLNLFVRNEADNLIDPSRMIAGIRFVDKSGDVQCTYTIGQDSVHVQFVDSMRVAARETVDLIMELAISSEPGVDLFSFWIDSSSDVFCRDETSGGLVAVTPSDGGTFPYNSGRAAVLQQNMEAAFANYPNPFVASSEQTRITFYMPGDGVVTLQVYTVTGRLVKTLIGRERRSAGLHQDTYWNGRNGRGEAVLNGVYFLVLETEINGHEQVMKRKVALVR